MKIFNNKRMVHSIKGFREIYKRHNDSMRFLLVNSRMDEVEESDKVMGDRCPSKAPTVGRIKKRHNCREEPIAEKSFVHFAEEWGARDVSEVVFTTWWV